MRMRGSFNYLNILFIDSSETNTSHTKNKFCHLKLTKQKCFHLQRNCEFFRKSYSTNFTKWTERSEQILRIMEAKYVITYAKYVASTVAIRNVKIQTLFKNKLQIKCAETCDLKESATLIF